MNSMWHSMWKYEVMVMIPRVLLEQNSQGFKGHLSKNNYSPCYFVYKKSTCDSTGASPCCTTWSWSLRRTTQTHYTSRRTSAVYQRLPKSSECKAFPCRPAFHHVSWLQWVIMTSDQDFQYWMNTGNDKNYALFLSLTSLAELEKEVHNIKSGLKALEAVSLSLPLLLALLLTGFMLLSSAETGSWVVQLNKSISPILLAPPPPTHTRSCTTSRAGRGNVGINLWLWSVTSSPWLGLAFLNWRTSWVKPRTR